MATTIQIDQQTHEILSHIRESTQAGSYNEVIMDLIARKISKKESLYGFLGKKSKKEIMEGLRDKNDRF